MASYLHQFSAVVQNKHFYGAIWDKFALNFVANLASKFKRLMLELQLLVVLFETNFVSKICTKASKKAKTFYRNKVQI